MRERPLLASVLALGFLAVACTAALAQSNHDGSAETSQRGNHWWAHQGRNSQYYLYTEGFWKAHFGSENQGSATPQDEQYGSNPWSSNGSWRERWTPSWSDHWNDAWGEDDSGKAGSPMEHHSARRSSSGSRSTQTQEDQPAQK